MTQTYHVKDWKPDADLNTGTPPLGAPEGHLRTNVNNIQREVIGAIRADWEGVAAAGGAWRDPNQGATVTRITGTQVTVGGLDVTHAFPVGRKVRISYSDEPGNNPGYAFVKTVAFVTDTTIDLEYFDDAAPDNTVRSGPSITSLSFYAAFGGGTAHQLGRAAFSDGTPGFIEPAALTAASIQLAIAAAAVNNDIVLLKAGTYVLEDTVAISADDRVWGRGVGVTILQAATGLNKTLIKFGDSCDDAELRDFSIDGNAVNQGGASIGIEGPSSGGGDRVRLHSLRISDTYSDGIKVNPTVTPCADWDLRDIEVVTTGEDCIHLAQPGAAITKVWLHRVSASFPGTGGAAVVNSDCIYWGMVAIASMIACDNSNAAGNGAGINSDAANDGSTLTGFSVVDTGAATARACLASVAGSGNLVATAGYLQSSNSDALDVSASNSIIANTFCDAASLDSIRGDNTMFTGCSFTTGGTRVEAKDVRFIGCSFFDQGGDAIDTLSGADGLVVKGCVFDTIVGDAVQLVSGVDDAIIDNNVYIAVGGAVNDSGTRTGKGPVFLECVAQPGIGTGEVIVTGMGDVSYPLPPNGSRRFVVDGYVTINLAAGSQVDFNFRSGILGTLGDGILASNVTTGAGIADDQQFNLGPVIVTPIAASTFTIGVHTPTGALNDIRANGYKSATTIATAGRGYISVRYLDG